MLKTIFRRLIKFTLWGAQGAFIIWVMTGDFRKLTVAAYFKIFPLYYGDWKLTELVMFCESVFILIFGIYFYVLARIIYKKLGARSQIYDIAFWGVIYVYFIFFIMFHQLYS